MDLCESKGLAQMIRIAQKVENKEDIRQEANLSGYSGEKVINSHNSTKANTIANTEESKGGMNWPMRTITLRGTTKEEVRKEGQTKRLFDAEFQSRKKGLCFRCNEKYSHDHKCKMKEQRELRMIVVKEEGEEYEIIEEGGIDQKELNAPEIVEESQVVVELSINYVVGLSNLGKMKVKEMIQGKVAIVLIDCGVTRNFISEKNSERVATEYKRNVELWSHFGLGHCSQREGNL